MNTLNVTMLSAYVTKLVAIIHILNKIKLCILFNYQYFTSKSRWLFSGNIESFLGVNLK